MADAHTVTGDSSRSFGKHMGVLRPVRLSLGMFYMETTEQYTFFSTRLCMGYTV